jgi:hypothetical protein
MAPLPIGEITSMIGNVGLARMRLDRLAKALNDQAAVSAKDVPIEMVIRDDMKIELDALTPT